MVASLISRVKILGGELALWFFISKMACVADFPVEKASAFDRQEFLSRM
jgi:hypothetical protein